jgi:hypothetical protein
MEEVSWASWMGHTLSSIAIVGSAFGWFPYFAAFLAACWYAVQLYESKTIQDSIKAHRLRKAARLRAKLMIVEELLKQTEKDE